MEVQEINHAKKNTFNMLAPHPLQSYEWGEFREKMGVKVIRRGFFEKEKIVNGFQMTIHKIPHTPWTIGYLPRGGMPTKEITEELQKIGQEERCVFIQLEPYAKQISNIKYQISNLGLRLSAKPFFHKYTFIIDLTKSEDELLKNMHPKTRYNIKIAQKHGVIVVEDNSDKAFETYLRLTKETTERQKFYAHSERYHRLLWETLKNQKSKIKNQNFNNLTAHLLTATYKGKIVTTWVLFVFKDTLYYPYGASGNEHKEVMASNLMMWEAIKYGKKLGLTKFDLWGCLGSNLDPKDPWYGFHKFKQGYGGELVEFIGSYDLVINPILYQFYKAANKARWMLLKLKKLSS